jgi:tyrosyl-tRNA synthetase
MDKINEILTRGVEEIIEKKHLEQQLRSKKKLRIKLGIDPTAKQIHIGRATVLWKLRDLQDLGHKIVLIIGDFTGLIGDTSDKDSERPMLSKTQIKENMKDYLAQVGKILDLKKAETHIIQLG